MKKIISLVGAAVVILGAGTAYAYKVWLPRQIMPQVEAQLANVRQHVDVSYPTLEVNPFSRSVTLVDVTFEHRTLPLRGTIGALEVKPAEATKTALVLTNPVLSSSEQGSMRAGLIEVTSLDQAFFAELLETWESGDRAALERLIETAPGGALSGVLVNDLAFEFEEVHLELDRLAIGSMDASKVTDLSLEGARWRDPGEVGERPGIDAGLVSIGSLNHGYFQELYQAALIGDEDAALALVANIPDGVIENFEINDLTFIDPEATPTDEPVSIGSITISGVSNDEIRDLGIKNLQFAVEPETEEDLGVVEGTIGSITIDLVPLWLFNEHLDEGTPCFGTACDDPKQAVGDLAAALAARGGLKLGTIAAADIDMTMMEDFYKFEKGSFEIPDLTFEISDNGRPYLANLTMRSDGVTSYMLDKLNADAFPPEQRQAFDLFQETMAESNVSFENLASSGEISLKTDPRAKTASFMMNSATEQFADLDIDLALVGLPEDLLTLNEVDSANQSMNAMLAEGASLVGASVNYQDHGLVDLGLSLGAKYSGKDRDQLIAELIAQAQAGLMAASPPLAEILLPEITAFLNEPKSFSLRLQPEKPTILSAIPFLAQSDPEQFLQMIGFEFVANR
ncbi:MAG: hypothetical protein ACR2Q4_18795 [Geminicoccaceae bacterium]